MPSFNWGRPEEGAPYTLIDVDENEIIYREHQPAEDIGAIVDQTRAFGQLTQSEKSTPHGTRWAGSVPITIYMDWLKEWKNAGHKHFTQDTYMALKFNNSDYSAFRDDRIVVPR